MSRITKYGSPVLGRKKLNHEGYEVHKGNQGLILWAFSLRDLCVLCGEKGFPVKNGGTPNTRVISGKQIYGNYAMIA
jgi:hypothetical protein